MHAVTHSFNFDLTTQNNINLWLEGPYDTEVKSEILRLLKEDPKLLLDAFYTNLTFGTAGLRGLMGIGTNRMNVYTVRAATQGLAHYIQKHSLNKSKRPAVLIGYDARHYSREFAEEAAKVLAGNHVYTYLFKELRPTPLVSFGCRYQNCIAALMITASHNPPAYNGYKVFWSDGGQVVFPHDEGIMHEIIKITDPTMVKIVASLSHPFIQEIATEIDDAYLAAISTLQNYPTVNQEKGHQLKVVYTSLHGTGITLVPKALQAWNFSLPLCVESQAIPDGSFPSVKSPNPEEPEALQMGITLLLKVEGDLLIATDPDADRMRVAVRHHNQPILLNGNQISVICLEHICQALSSQNRIPPRTAFIKTIGTTELFQAICQAYQLPCFNVLTGFKYIAEKIQQWESLANGYQYLFGTEESYGYLLGNFARDKDAVISAVLIAEVTLQAKLEGKTLIDKLHELYHKYGIYQEKLLTLDFDETKAGKQQMVLRMKILRELHLKQVAHIPIIAVEDYLTSTKIHLPSGKIEPLTLPISNLLLYWLEDGSKIMIRPSGTEPKVKIYCGVFEKKFSSLAEGMTICHQRCDDLLHFMQKFLISKEVN